MAVIRSSTNYEDSTVDYLAAVAFLCSASCIILMMKFRGFRASLNFASGKNVTSELAENITPVSVAGAYRINTEEFFGTGSYESSPKKITPSMVKLPNAFQPDPTDPDVIKASKSTTNIVEAINIPPNLSKSTPDVSLDPRGAPASRHRNSTDLRSTNTKDAKTQAKEQKKLEKKRLAEQKKREKLEAQERAKEEKMTKEAEKFEAKQEKIRKEKEKAEQAEAAKQNKKAAAKPARNPLARVAGPTNPSQTTQEEMGYSTNTLESSISKVSGPPPYSDNGPAEVTNPAIVQNENDNTGNTSFGQPIETDNTWDLISQHREQISRVPLPVGGKQAGGAKQTIMRFKLADPNSGNNDAVTGRKSLYV